MLARLTLYRLRVIINGVVTLIILIFTNSETNYNKNKYMFDKTSEQVLSRGLNAMTKMCDVLTKQNETLNNDIEKLKKKIDRMKERLLANGIEAD